MPQIPHSLDVQLAQEKQCHWQAPHRNTATKYRHKYRTAQAVPHHIVQESAELAGASEIRRLLRIRNKRLHHPRPTTHLTARNHVNSLIQMRHILWAPQ